MHAAALLVPERSCSDVLI